MIDLYRGRMITAGLCVLVTIMAVVPVYGYVINNNPISLTTGSTSPFVTFSNNTTSLVQSKVLVSDQGDKANLSVSGVWTGSNYMNPIVERGIISQITRGAPSAYSYLVVTSFNGSANVSSLALYLNGSDGANQMEINYSGGHTTDYSVPVEFTSAVPLNFSIAFSPVKPSANKIYQTLDASITLEVMSHSSSGAVYLQGFLSIALTMTIIQ